MSEPLVMWTIYDHPADYPNNFVAREWACDASGATPTGSFIVSPDLELLRHMMITDLHLTCLARNENDDPKIVETWL